MTIAAICPDCQGCGHISFDQFGRPHPQPTFTGAGTATHGWHDCTKCAGSGLVSSIPNARFSNGLRVDEYLQNRFGPDA